MWLFFTNKRGPLAKQVREHWHSWYTDSLWAGWSWDRIPVGARFSETFQSGPGANPASCTMGNVSLSGGKAAGAWH